MMITPRPPRAACAPKGIASGGSSKGSLLVHRYSPSALNGNGERCHAESTFGNWPVCTCRRQGYGGPFGSVTSWRGVIQPSGAPLLRKWHDFLRAGDSGALLVVPDNKRLTRLLSGECAVTRPELRIAPADSSINARRQGRIYFLEPRSGQRFTPWPTQSLLSS